MTGRERSSPCPDCGKAVKRLGMHRRFTHPDEAQKEPKEPIEKESAVTTAVAPVPPQSIIVARSDITRYVDSFREQASEDLAEMEKKLATAKARLQPLEEIDVDAPTAGQKLALRLGLDDQVWRHNPRAQRAALRSRVTKLTRRTNTIRRFINVLDAGYVPMPRLPALRLEYAYEEIPVEAMESMEVAKETGLFDEFRIVNGRDAWDSGVPRREGHRMNVKDPILVGVVNGELFPLAWWR